MPGLSRTTAAAASAIMSSSGTRTAAWIAACQKWAVLQGIASSSAPQASSRLAMPIRTGAGLSPPPAASAAAREGMWGLLSTSMRMCSASSRAGVARTTRAIRSTVAIGPMPPMMPTVRPRMPSAPPRASVGDLRFAQ